MELFGTMLVIGACSFFGGAILGHLKGMEDGEKECTRGHKRNA